MEPAGLAKVEGGENPRFRKFTGLAILNPWRWYNLPSFLVDFYANMPYMDGMG